MMMMSGYTLGFFFPKQAKHIAADQPKVSSVGACGRTEPDRSETSPVLAADGGEVPASFYFYRYF
jgi:hypothetical protein